MSLVPLPRRTLSWRKLSCRRKITRRRVTQAPGGIVLVLAHAHATGHLHQDLLGAVDPLQDITGRGRRVVVAREARMARMAAVMTIMGVTRTSEQKVAQRRKSELCSAWISFVIVRSDIFFLVYLTTYNETLFCVCQNLYGYIYTELTITAYYLQENWFISLVGWLGDAQLSILHTRKLHFHYLHFCSDGNAKDYFYLTLPGHLVIPQTVSTSGSQTIVSTKYLFSCALIIFGA